MHHSPRLRSTPQPPSSKSLPVPHQPKVLALPVLLLLLLGCCTEESLAASCGLAEISCKAGHCLPVDAYCNGVDDCGDGSDEPALCTPCNRTYHGREGRTYRLDLPRPAEGKLPFLCHLTFTAGGHGHGELVQLLWDAFSIGRLDAEAEDVTASCPEGSMQLAELGRPFTGGSWCGPGEGRATYYSETSTVTASIRLFSAPPSVPFEFRLRYRFVSRPEAIARLGSLESPIERGSPVPGTYCSRNFYECYQRTCRVQSPNYPGEYPRNASCLVTLRQKEVPTCKHAMMSVKSSSSAASGLLLSNHTAQGQLTVWQECPEHKDRLIIRDGSRPEDPVLLIYCGGLLPRITARGPAMLLEFRSSAQAVALGASALRLELETQVVYVDSDGLDYAQTPTGCFFIINGTARRSGPMRAPLHALPPGTNCTWNIKGAAGDRIWLYFASYWQRDLRGGTSEPSTSTSNYSALPLSQHQMDSQHQPPESAPCTVKLTLWDGAPATGQPLAVLCDESPKLCAHAALRNSTRTTRPCGLDESYLTQAPSLTVRMETVMGTALNTVSFNARYEFISTVQGGEQWGEPNLTCSRLYRRMKAGVVSSPRDLRFFGRGGARRLDCRYRIEAAAGERVKLTVHNVSLGELTACNNEPDPHSARPRCVPEPGSREARLSIYEAPWKDVRLPRTCLCDNTSALLPMVHVTSGRALEITFYVDAMTPDEDFESLYFNATFELVRAPECSRKQRVRGEGGELRFVSPPFSRPDIYCDGLPWLVEARDNRSLFLLTWGWLLPLDPNAAADAGEPAKCPTKNRLLLYSGWPLRLRKVICPSEPEVREYTVHVFSEEWLGEDTGTSFPGPVRSPAMLLDFVAREQGQAAVSWLEISKSRQARRSQLLFEAENGSLTRDCPHKCPELGACISASLWCDGHVHCPSGHDEANCGSGARLLGLLPSAMWLVILSCIGLVSVFGCLIATIVSR
ncbi:uncharacterized protein LOC106640896 [Copidosoma floridanum]|uniref:uncharacterized protein LOC106640896 n=1 Tax=Copidosoma floridanum TaxID=29053 RepID=UPI000C6F9691|nr:uncharacterized protein LOC106640896 [Copidosoma floridanum]